MSCRIPEPWSFKCQNYTSDAINLSPPSWLHCSLYSAPHPCPSLVGCLPSSNAIGTQRDAGPVCLRSNPMPL
uniref:Uncharacterized protein n=1 Tax=Mesocestoides corti TaxID=53468 RepID=A0A5K3FLT2_MESCO